MISTMYMQQYTTWVWGQREFAIDKCTVWRAFKLAHEIFNAVAICLWPDVYLHKLLVWHYKTSTVFLKEVKEITN